MDEFFGDCHYQAKVCLDELMLRGLGCLHAGEDIFVCFSAPAPF